MLRIGICDDIREEVEKQEKQVRQITYRRFSMTQAVTYERETKSVAFQGKIIVLESLTPVLPPKEKAQRKKEIERCLYEVFRKYGDRFP